MWGVWGNVAPASWPPTLAIIDWSLWRRVGTTDFGDFDFGLAAAFGLGTSLPEADHLPGLRCPGLAAVRFSHALT